MQLPSAQPHPPLQRRPHPRLLHPRHSQARRHDNGHDHHSIHLQLSRLPPLVRAQHSHSTLSHRSLLSSLCCPLPCTRHVVGSLNTTLSSSAKACRKSGRLKRTRGHTSRETWQRVYCVYVQFTCTLSVTMRMVPVRHFWARPRKRCGSWHMRLGKIVKTVVIPGVTVNWRACSVGLRYTAPVPLLDCTGYINPLFALCTVYCQTEHSDRNQVVMKT